MPPKLRLTRWWLSKKKVFRVPSEPEDRLTAAGFAPTTLEGRVVSALASAPLGDSERLAEALENIVRVLRTPGDGSATTVGLEERKYTYVSAIIDVDGRPKFKKFLVPTRSRTEARKMALRYAELRGWTLLAQGPGSGFREGFELYPANYVKESRKLFEQGAYLGAP